MPTLSELIDAGAHFGHKKERSHPRAKDFTYTIRDSIFVIDLEQTIAKIQEAIGYLKKARAEGKIILFVGTKNQAKVATKKTAQNLGMPFVVERWLGGMLTNFETIRKNLDALTKLEELIKSEEFAKFTKRERKRMEEKATKLNATFEGLKGFKNLPDILFIVDTAKENVAVLEARRMDIPIIGICDTNTNPDLIDFPIPANDDSEKAIELIMGKIDKGVKERVVTKDRDNKEKDKGKKDD